MCVGPAGGTRWRDQVEGGCHRPIFDVWNGRRKERGNWRAPDPSTTTACAIQGWVSITLPSGPMPILLSANRNQAGIEILGMASQAKIPGRGFWPVMPCQGSQAKRALHSQKSPIFSNRVSYFFETRFENIGLFCECRALLQKLGFFVENKALWRRCTANIGLFCECRALLGM